MKNKITILEAYPIEIEIKISLVGNQFEILQNEFLNNLNLLHSFNLKKQGECVYFLNVITDISCIEDIKQILYKLTDIKQVKCEECKYFSTGKQPDGFKWHKCEYNFECKRCFNDYFESKQ